MIYTLTLNPSLDYHVSVGEFKLGETNRNIKESLVAGGKGINVSRVLKNLGVPNLALGIVAGFTGDEIERQLNDMGVLTKFIKATNGASRINVKVDDVDGTEINGIGPLIGAYEANQLMMQLMSLKASDYLVLSGSVCKGLTDAVYAEIIDALAYKGVKVVVDASGNTLRNTLSKHPYLVKPNKREALEIFGGEINDLADAVAYARRFVEMGAEHAIVSLGAAGAVYADARDAYMLEAYEGAVVSAVGAGDSMVAGFLAEMLKSGDSKKAFEMAVATSAATAFSGELATKASIDKLINDQAQADQNH